MSLLLRFSYFFILTDYAILLVFNVIIFFLIAAMAFKIKMRLLLWRDSEGNNRIIFIRWQPVRTANERDSGIVLDINFCHVPCKSQERWRVAHWYQRMQCVLFYSHKRVENTLLQDLKLILWWFHNSVDTMLQGFIVMVCMVHFVVITTNSTIGSHL